MATFHIYSTTRLDSLCLAHAPGVVFYTPNGGTLNIICDDPAHARSLLIGAIQQLDEEIQEHSAPLAE